MGIEIRLRGALGPTTYPADTAVLRFSSSGLVLDLTRDGRPVYLEEIALESLDGLEASDQQGFAVLVQDRSGTKRGAFHARWLCPSFPVGYDVAFGIEPRKTKRGMEGQVWAARASADGRVVVDGVRIRDC